MSQSERPIPILTYHQVAPPPPSGTPFRSLTVAPGVFARHMRALRMLGWRGLSMHELMPYLSGEREGKVFGLTFDDGYRNVLQHALPVLRATGHTATNYFVAAHAGGTNFWDAGNGVPAAALMNEDEIRSWAAAGMEVGSHTLDHARLTELAPDDARRQIDHARARLETVVQQPVEAFCYPYGAYAPEHADMARAAGYRTATTTRRGRTRRGDDPWHLRRVPVVRSTHLLGLLQKMMTAYEDRRGEPA
ncbi:polysaccharide deacetylase family protein [Verticiella sediminum]|uniref:Polysaccharide deacetylase family protein n=1 Tax=Verticiella sediminum TaxID=1247510 RepID=A0A556AU14_9BURK|nr:polysaccharide deacetylase family protein [Verticiella sediminum]TSH96410.1 polysaccharide deacetylase family protein [Verticiella sediminum]